VNRLLADGWFRDAKFGIWAHWGPQSAPEQGDWYARRMYIEGEAQYKWHREHFGPQSKVGFKDVIPTFKGEKFDPEHLLDLVPEGRREVLRQHGGPPRQFRYVELQAHALERGEYGAEEGRGGAVPPGGAEARAQIRRQRALVDQL
jgi:hypothetical protein